MNTLAAFLIAFGVQADFKAAPPAIIGWAGDYATCKSMVEERSAAQSPESIAKGEEFFCLFITPKKDNS
jgi:hypothetical protein